MSDAHDLAKLRLGFDHSREVQSVTWEGVRDLWGEGDKTAALKNDIANIWRQNAGNPDEAHFRAAERLWKPIRRVYAVP